MRPSSACFHLGWIILVKTEKITPCRLASRIIILQQAVGANVPVEDIDVRFRVQFFDVEGVLNGALAADAGTIGILLVSGAHALDHDHPVEVIGASSVQAAFQFNLGHDTIILAIEKLVRVVFLGARGQNHDAMVDLSLVHARAHHDFSGEISLESAETNDEGFRQYLDFFMSG